MRIWTNKEYCKMLEYNGFHFSHTGKGSHSIYINDKNQHISIPKEINPCIAKRLIKTFGLTTVFLIFALGKTKEI